MEGLSIAHLSDLHNKRFGNHQEQLLGRLREEKPDLIAITGDLIDSRRTRPEIALNFVKSACEIAPVYFCARQS